MITLIKGDCLEELPRLILPKQNNSIIKEKIDLVLVDLPYAQTACKWDSLIDLNKMWIELKKICKRDCIYVFFCTTKFGYKLIQSNERWFRYDLVWEKSRKVGFLSANKMPLRKHEMVYVFKDKQGTYHPQKTEGKPYIRDRTNDKSSFSELYNVKNTDITYNKGDRHPTSILQFDSLDLVEPNNDSHEMVYVFADANTDDLENNRNLGLREYAEKVKHFINKPIKEIDEIIGNQGVHHFYSFNSTQFGLPTEKTYNKLIEKYNLRDMPGFREYQSLKDEWEKILQGTYNPQKTEGKPYKTNGINLTNSYYRGGKKEYKGEAINNKGDRHPTSILQFDSLDFEYQNRIIPERNHSNHEMVYVFANTNDEENKPLDFNQNIRDYAKCIKSYINKSTKEIINDVNNTGISHFFTNGHQFRMILEKDYNKLIEKYNLRDMPGFREYKSLKDEWENPPPKILSTYNPQKTEGKPYTLNQIKPKDKELYGNQLGINYKRNNKGDRHPTSILQFPDDSDRIIPERNHSNHEMVYVFKDKQGTYNPQKTEGKPYKIQEGNITDGHVYGKKKRGSINNKGDRHPTSILQFDRLDLVEPNNDSHEMVYVFKDKQGTYNPQKTEGKPYKHSGVRSSNLIYGGGLECSNQERTDRHPTTILKFNNPHKTVHRTQKPVDLCEWLVKTYSNEGENVLDFTMGSGSTGIACLNTNRNFIGIEKDPDIFKVGQHRLFKHELELTINLNKHN